MGSISKATRVSPQRSVACPPMRTTEDPDSGGVSATLRVSSLSFSGRLSGLSLSHGQGDFRTTLPAVTLLTSRMSISDCDPATTRHWTGVSTTGFAGSCLVATAKSTTRYAAAAMEV